MRLSLILLLACTASKDDTGSADTSETDTDTDTDSDTDTDTDTDTDPGTAAVSGCVSAYDGAVMGGMEVQVCDLLCIRVTTDTDGCFTLGDLDAGDYKVDAMGELVDGGHYGHSRLHVPLTAGQVATYTDSHFLPEADGPTVVTQGTYTFGDVSWTVDVADLDTPFGYEDDEFWISWVAGADVPTDIGLVAEGAVAFMPFDTEVSGAFDLSIAGTWAAAEYDVYAQGHHGEIEAPIATATAADGVLTVSQIQPELLTWLIFVAK